jgi:site-specific DNA-methyltransferase (adenine-specific)
MTHKVEALKHIFNWDWVGIWNKPFSAGCRAGNSPIVPHYEPIFMWGIHKIGVRGEGFSDVFSFNPTGNGQTKGEHGRVALSTKTEGHKFPKPPSLLSSLIKVMGIDSIKIICDPFLGTGTTCHISKSLNIQSVGIEIEEKYCEIAAKRCSQEVMELSL